MDLKYKRISLQFLVIVLCSILLVLGSCSKTTEQDKITPTEKVRIASFNLRYNNANDVGNLWSARKHLVGEILRIHQFDIFGAQEPYIDQLRDLGEVAPAYAYVGRSRTGETSFGEFVPIFYNKNKFDVLESSQFWLSETDTEQPNTSWDAAQPRICVWAKMQDKNTRKTFFVFNTHLDHIGPVARQESTKLLIKKIPEIAGNLPFFLTGDFNFDQNHGNYQILKSSSIFVDSYDVAERKVNAGRGTLNSFNVNSTSTARIDHVFLGKGHVKVLHYQIITDSFQGKLPSDHFPVMIEVEL